MKEVKERMMAAIFEVFEKMFYVFLEPVGDDCSEYDMGAAIQFSGAQKGELKILASEGLAKSMVQHAAKGRVNNVSNLGYPTFPCYVWH